MQAITKRRRYGFATGLTRLSAILIAASAIPLLFSWQAKASSVRWRGHLLRVMSCEAMFNSRVKNHALKESVLPSLRDAMHILRKPWDWRGDVGISFNSAFSSRPIGSIGQDSSLALLRRFSGIEQSLTSHNMNEQVMTMEFRGNQINEVLKELPQIERILTPEYQRELKQLQPLKSKIYNWVGFHGLAALWAMGIAKWMIGFNNPAGTYLGIGFFGMVYLMNYYSDRQKIYDVNHTSFISKLTKAIQSNRQNMYLVSSSNFTVPVEFHEALMKNESEPTEASSQARQLALRLLGVPFYQAISATAPLRDPNRAVRNAGDSYRYIFLDQIAFYDRRAQEPVWIFVYRAYRSRPISTRPARSKSQKVESKQSVWAPGAASPLPIPIHRRGK